MDPEKIAYKFNLQHHPGKDIVFVNIIPRYTCLNNCLFCERQEKKDNIYEAQVGYDLWLDRVPTIEEVVDAVSRRITKHTKEIAFVGMGEPMIYFDRIVGSVTAVKQRFPAKDGYSFTTRVNTNGLVYYYFGYRGQVQRLVEAGLDGIRISVNAVSSEEYKAMCNPPYKPGRDPFKDLQHFVRVCNDSPINTEISYVVGFKSEIVSSRVPKDYIESAREIGIDKSQIIFRQYTTAKKCKQNVRIKDGTIDDVINSINDIKEKIPEKADITVEEILGRMERRPSGVKIAYQNDNKVGWMAWYEKNPETAYVWLGIVDKPNSGIGGRLMECIICDTKHYKFIEAKTQNNNSFCKGMLNKQGFEIIQETDRILDYRLCL